MSEFGIDDPSLGAGIYRIMRGSTRELNMLRIATLISIVALALAACGGDSDSATETEPPATSLVSTTAPPAASTTSSTTSAPTTTPGATTTSVTTSTVAPGVEGDAYDLWVPQPDEPAIIGVVGVRHDDTLNLRSGPGVTFEVLATLDPTFDRIIGTGEAWQLPSGEVWWKIDAGVEGWANQRYMSRLSGVDDVTSFIVDRLGEIPAAETMLDLGLTAVDGFAGFDVPTTVVSVAPTVADLGEITLDVVGIGDDSEGGFRLHVFGQPTEGGDGFSLMAVEATRFCQRGVDEGRCV